MHSQDYEYFNDSVNTKLNTESIVSKTRIKVAVGTSFGSYQGSGYSFNNYIAPYLSYDINARLRVNAGGVFQNSTYNNVGLFGSEQNTILNGNVLNSSLFVQGQYKLNNRVTVTGTVFKNVYTLPMNNNNLDFSSEGMAIAFDYKLSNKASIGVELQFSNGASPYSPFGNRMYNSSGFGSPYHFSSGW